MKHLLWLAILLPMYALADDDSDSDSDRRLNISQVFVNDTSIMIIGEDLLFGRRGPRVKLGEFPPLTIISETDTLIEASLPVDISDGDYRLSVSGGKGKSKNDEYDLTIGAVGPQGDKGDTGDAGPQGETGATGDTGATGAPGDQGPQGTQGLQGPIGMNGAPGMNGANCWEAVDGGSSTADCIGAPGEDGAVGQSCTVAACSAEGVTTLSCGATQVEIPCVVDSTGGLTIASMSPNQGFVGDTVTISGTGFGSTVSVSFNGSPAVITSATLTAQGVVTIIVTVPANATSGNVIVTSGGNSALAGAFTVL